MVLQENKARISLDHNLPLVRQCKYYWPWCKESVKLGLCAASCSLADESTFTLSGQYYISHLTFCVPMPGPFPLGSHCWWWLLSNVNLTALEVCAEGQGKPLLSSTAPDFFQICLPLTCFLSKTHLSKPSRQHIYGCSHPAGWSCNCLMLSLPQLAVQTKVGLGGHSSSCPHLKWH